MIGRHELSLSQRELEISGRTPWKHLLSVSRGLRRTDVISSDMETLALAEKYRARAAPSFSIALRLP